MHTQAAGTNGMMDGYAMYYVYAIIISISTRELWCCVVCSGDIISTCSGGDVLPCYVVMMW